VKEDNFMPNNENDAGMGFMDATVPEYLGTEQEGGEGFQAEFYSDENSAQEGGVQDEAQSQETEKPKKRRKKQDDNQPDDQQQEFPDSVQPDDIGTEYGEQPDSDGQDGGDFVDGEEAGMDEPDGLPPEDDAAVETTPRRRRAIGLDGQGRTIYDRGDMGQHDLSILTGARNARRILTATIDGIDTDGDSLPRVVFYVGTVKVLIPFAEMGMDLNPGEIDQGQAARIIDSMLGAKIDYMVRGVDAPNRIAGASRRAAMLLRRQTILNARAGDGFRVNMGSIVTARVLQVFRASMLVEVFGYQTYIRRSGASSLWVNDIRDFAQVGDEKQVEVVTLERDPATGEATYLEVSVKGAEDIPHTELRTGNTYTGTVTGFSDTAYFVRVTGVPLEVRCPINSNFVMDMMDVGDSVKFVVRGVYDGRPTGSIRRINKKAAANR
jgi:small subunit ribosomal protein S1